MLRSSQAVYLVAELVIVLFGASLAETRLTIRINGGQETTNVDALVSLEAMVSFSCSDDAATGSLNVNGVPTTLPKESDGVWIINSMSLADQGAYQCCVESRCEEVAVITVPPDNNVMVVAAEGERPTLSCPLEFAKRLGQHYTAEWRVPVNITIAKSRSGALQPWAHLNDNTLALTVGPLNSSLPRVFECVILSFNWQNMLQISNVPKGIVNIALASSQKLQVTVSPSVITSGSGRRFMISCGTKNGQMLYNAVYQFFFNGKPIGTGTPSNSSYIMVYASSSSNFTCNATQYSDLGTPIPSQLSPPVQAIVLDAPTPPSNSIELQTSPTTGNSDTIIVLSAILGVLAVLLLSAVGICVPIVTCVYYRSKQSRRRFTERMIQSVDFHRSGQANTEVVNFLTINEDAWEIPRSEIEVGGKLGQGNYGAVFKGQLTVTAMSPKLYAHKQEMEFEGKSHYNVAVKMLRCGSRNHEKKLFMDEIKVMKRVSDDNNPHVLKMLGCITTTNPMMLILQFVPHGNLKNYLRAMKAADDDGDFKTTGADPAPGVTPGSHSCSSLSTQAPDIAPLLKKFTSFSYQIASGMEFLMSKEVIHRDLACRNVLVGDNELLKICDFGLAKETLEYMSPSALIKTQLPIRWLSPEVFLRGTFSEKSDVWAYGVCLWEIFSFGDQPYSELGNTVLLSSIMAGYRLESPIGCPDHIYSIMKECWNDDKESRPTFMELKEELDAFISQEEKYNYLLLDSEAMESVVPTPQPPK